MSAPKFSLPRFAINHPHLTIVMSLLMVVLGAFSYLTMPARMAPRIPAKTLGVVVQFPGMPAEEIHRYITQPLEKKLQIAVRKRRPVGRIILICLGALPAIQVV